MNTYRYEDLIVEVFDDPTHIIGSVSNNSYLHYYYTDGCQDPKGSFHGVKLYEEGIEIKSCLLVGSGGTTIHKTSSMLKKDELLICCGDTVFCIGLPTLKCKWQAHVDFAACFQIFNLLEGYIVHGECEISRLDSDGKVVWSFAGADIFVSLSGESFLLDQDRIQLLDFTGNRYTIDFNGKLIKDTI